jgi:DNA polymerase-1
MTDTAKSPAKREKRVIANHRSSADDPVGKGSHVFLVDGSGYIFRAFHALPPLSRPSDGLPVGAVHGFCQMLWKLLKDSREADKPTHIAVIFDAARENFRNEIYKDYKAHRPPAPEELIPQFPLIRDAVKAFNVACIEQDGYEADDLIATYAKQTHEAGGDVTIVSSDKDLMQLVKPGVAMLDTMKNRRIGSDEVVERFGVGPDKVVDVQSLAGDSTDNVPGVPGIGVKTAAELIKEYGDLDTLLARATEIKQPKRREKLIEFADQARMSRELVRLKDDVPVEVALAETAVKDPDPDALLSFMRTMEFNTLTRRVAEALGADVPPPLEKSVGDSVSRKDRPKADGKTLAKAPGGGLGSPEAGVAYGLKQARSVAVDPKTYETVTTTGRLAEWIGEAEEIGRVAFDTETDSLDAMQANLVGVALALGPGRACYVPLGHRAGGGFDFGGATAELTQIPLQEALALLKPMLENRATLKIGQNLKYDALVMRRYGIRIDPIDDTMLLSYVLDAGKGGNGMDELSERHLGHVPIAFKDVIAKAPGGAKKADRTFAEVPIADATQYSAEDADVTYRLWQVLKPRLAAERMTTVYETLERPLVAVLVEMEAAGIKVDRSILSRLSGAFAQRSAALESEVKSLIGDQSFNLGSPKQLGELLFDRLKLPGGKKTKTGQWETRAGLLDDLAGNEELPEDARRLVNTMLEWRQLTKLRSTYTDALPGYIHPETGRIHTSYALAATSTGRLSSTDPNLQNIPVRTKEGREIRTAFIAEQGHELVSADYSQIELRVLAHMADIPQLKEAFAKGLDIHAMTASEMFGVPIKGMPPEVRRRAKAINFGIIYGISAFGLANQLGISKQEAGDYITTYFKRFPGIRDYMEGTKKLAREQGFVTTLFGRKIHFPEINTKNPSMRGFLERAAINAPIQGSAADIIRRAMVRMPAALRTKQLRARMLLQVHDELVFEVPEGEIEKTLPVVAKVMEKSPEPALKLSVPLKVDAKAAGNWEAAH